MNQPTNKPTLALLSAAALSVLALGAAAQDKPRSLNDARQGNTSGIVIWEQKKTPAPAPAAAPASAPAVAGGAASPTSMNAAKAEPTGSGSPLGRIFSTLREQNPPSGKSMGSAKKLDAPGQGIPVPTAPAASAGGR